MTRSTAEPMTTSSGGDDDDTLEGGDAVGTAEPGSDLADYSSSGVGVTVV